MLFGQRRAGRQAFAVADGPDRQRADFVAALHCLYQRFAFQQGAEGADGKAVTRPTVSTTLSTLTAATAALSPAAVLNRAPSGPVLMITACTPRSR